jgi:polyisoprenoid-binding protein YceI
MRPPTTRLLAALLLAALLGACGSAAAPAPAATATPAASGVPSPDRAAAPGSWTVGAASKATARVREQLVGVSAPSDAVLVATGGKGTFALNPDGTFSSDSKISFDLSTLASDNRNRDDFVKRSTLAVQQFPTADLVPLKATSLRLPLPASGDFTFRLAAKLTIRGITKDVTFAVVAKRSGGDLTATAMLDPSLKFGDFGMSAPSVPTRVISVVDEIRLLVDLVATGPAS